MQQRRSADGAGPAIRPVRPFPSPAAVFMLAAGLFGATPIAASTPEEGAGMHRQRTILVTGSTDGLGREVALRLAETGAHVIVHGRNRERGEAVVEEIRRAGRGSASFHAADLGSLDEVRAFARTILDGYDRLDVLVNNAGIWLSGRDERQLSPDGHELQFAVNYLAGYLLTRLLMPLLEAAPDARIVNVASAAQTPIDFDDVMLERGYTGSRGYAQSKLAQVIFTVDLAEELADRNITVLSLHPATLMDTRMVADAGVSPRTTIAEGADALMHVIDARDVESGQYFNGRRPARANEQAYDAEARERLREISRALTGV